ncbi:MAG: flagellar hook-associated protein 3 [Gammaproteobacteria bacterium]|nr:flagellar hook-associated protein 3 [Gammaproteobacteria bacterium]
MRVSTSGAFASGLAAMQRLQAALDQTQRQISSGRRILTPSDDPIAASRALEIRESIGRLEQFDRNANIASNRLSQEESALGSVNNVLQRVRELALQANNATQSNESRRMIAIEMRQHLDQLLQIANQKDGNGSHLFSGNLESTTPVTRMGAAFSYNGDQGQRYIQVGEGRQVADGDSGAAVFFNIRNGNGSFTTMPAGANAGSGVLGPGSVVDPSAWDQDQYTVRFIDPANYEVLDSSAAVVTTGAFQAGDTLAFRGIEFSLDGQPEAGDEFNVAPSRYQDVFSVVDQISTALEQGATGPAEQAALNNSINAGLLNIDQAIGNVLDVRIQVGSRLAAIENQVDSNGAFELTLRETLANIEDLDYAEALSRLSLEVTTLEAAQQSFVRTQSLSLFNYF